MGKELEFYFEGSIYGYQEQCARCATSLYSQNSVDVQSRDSDPSVLHSVIIVNKRIFALLFCFVLGLEASLTQSLARRVVHFDSTSAPAGG